MAEAGVLENDVVQCHAARESAIEADYLNRVGIVTVKTERAIVPLFALVLSAYAPNAVSLRGFQVDDIYCQEASVSAADAVPEGEAASVRAC